MSLQAMLKLSVDKKGQPLVFDPLRKKFIVITPEEIVRQLWILYFLEIRKVNKKLIAVERVFKMEGMIRRFDLVIFDKATHLFLLAEFKAPGIKISQATFDQIARYNLQLQVPYALISNGSAHYCFQIDDDKKEFLWRDNIPV